MHNSLRDSVVRRFREWYMISNSSFLARSASFFAFVAVSGGFLIEQPAHANAMRRFFAGSSARQETPLSLEAGTPAQIGVRVLTSGHSQNSRQSLGAIGPNVQMYGYDYVQGAANGDPAFSILVSRPVPVARLMAFVEGGSTAPALAIVGENGSGRTFLVRDLATFIHNNRRPYRIISPDVQRIASGGDPAAVRRQIEGFLDEIAKYNDAQAQLGANGEYVVVYLPEGDSVLGGGGNSNSRVEDTAMVREVIQSRLAAGRIRMIVEASQSGYSTMTSTPAMRDLVEQWHAPAPSEQELHAILLRYREMLNAHYNMPTPQIYIDSSAVDAAIRYARNRGGAPGRVLAVAQEYLRAAAAIVHENRSVPPSEVRQMEARLQIVRAQLRILESDQTHLRSAAQEKIRAFRSEVRTLQRDIEELRAAWEAYSQGHLHREQNRLIGLESRSEEQNQSLASISQLIADMEKKLHQGFLEGAGVPIVNDGSVRFAASRLQGLSMEQISESYIDRVMALPERLRGRVIGQDHAVELVAESFMKFASGIGERRPQPVLFQGPSGVGKTQLVKLLAKLLYPGVAESDVPLLVLDMAEFMSEHNIAQLLGSTIGYEGSTEGGRLVNFLRRHPDGIILLDEIEKAHPKILVALMALLDDGRVTDGRGQTVDGRNAKIFLTTNLGAKEFAQAREALRLGAEHLDRADRLAEEAANILRKHVSTNEESDRNQAEAIRLSSEIPHEKSEYHRLHKQYIALMAAGDEAIRGSMRPELYGRISERVDFNPLTPQQTEEIARIFVKERQDELKQFGVTLNVSNAVFQALGEHGFSPMYGARPLRTLVKRTIEGPVGAIKLLIEQAQGHNQNLLNGTEINVAVNGDGLFTFETVASCAMQLSPEGGKINSIATIPPVNPAANPGAQRLVPLDPRAGPPPAAAAPAAPAAALGEGSAAAGAPAAPAPAAAAAPAVQPPLTVRGGGSE